MKIKSLTMILLAGTLAACSGTEEKPVDQNTPLPEVETVEDEAITAIPDDVDDGNAIDGGSDDLSFLEILDDPTSPLSNTTVYFGFDQHDVSGEYAPTLDAHAAFLMEHADLQVVLEGYADERGTPEYNLALGEKRAIAVRDYLQVLGVSANQIEMVSYGEENPVAEGHNEAVWAQNRRVKLAYSGR